MNNEQQNVEHHKRQEYCTTRLRYRQGRQLKAVKAYTVANESKHLLIFGVPRVNLQQEIKRSCQRYGQLDFIKSVTQNMAAKLELEQFTDVFHIKYAKLEQARRAKRFLDATQFYGGILHISYAPELESTDELRAKLLQRSREIMFRTRENAKNS